jgi:hypothetical protein
MLVQLNIEDKILSEKISDYVESKHKEINELVIEALESFLSKNGTKLNYQIEDIEKNSSVIDFNLDDNTIEDVKLFEEIEDVKKYSKELRDNAWK